MKTFEVEGWYRYNNGNDKDYIIKEIVCNTPKQAIEIFNIKYKHIGFFKIDIKEIIMKQVLYIEDASICVDSKLSFI